MDPTPADPGQGVIIARERIGLAAGAALLMAGLILVIAVLPAEYGVDPLGIGRRLGLMAMSDVAKSVEAFEADSAAAGPGVTLAPQEGRFQQETVEFTIRPGSFIEYKYRLEKGEALLYSWSATGAVNYDFHAEPDGAPRGYAESYDKRDTIDRASGTLAAPFSGIHGWYWENRSGADVMVTLAAAGFFNVSHEFRPDAEPITKFFKP
jgi:hypothetical protein